MRRQLGKQWRKRILTGMCIILLGGLAACGNKGQTELPGGTETASEATVTGTAATAPTGGAVQGLTSTPRPTLSPTATPTPTEAPEINLQNYTIKEEAEKYGFTFGGPFSAVNLVSSKYKNLVKNEFNSITATNEMKAYSLLDRTASQKNPDGMPVMNYETADRIVEYAQSIGIGVRGHVLVWDAYMSNWFFREGYTYNGAYVDAETMKARLKYYIEEVITHFETKYPGVVYCWDVVNEAVGDGTSEYKAGDLRHVRTMRGDSTNPFYDIIGEDYVELSFLWARDTVERLQAENPEVSIDLFYNDYSTFQEGKRDAIIELLRSINSYAKDENGNYRKLCDGMGMQSYIGGYGTQSGCMNAEDIEKIRTAILMYHDLGLQVHITEMAVRNYDPEKTEEHATFYGKLFRMFTELNAEETVITNISIWGCCDNPYLPESDYAYTMNGPYCGIFNEKYERKLSYDAALKAVMEEAGPAKQETESIPTKYSVYNASSAGRIVKIEYPTKDYGGTGAELTKSAYVYLPPNYDESKQYNVLYLMHGIGGNEKEWGMTGSLSVIKMAMDNLIGYGDIEPFIIVTPNGRAGAEYAYLDGSVASYAAFGEELRNDLIPYIDANYATYAEYNENGYDLTAAREHRAMAGCSIGADQTITIGMGECLDMISWFGAFSTDLPEEEQNAVEKQVQSSAYEVNGFYETNSGTGFAVWNIDFYNFAQLVFDKGAMVK